MSAPSAPRPIRRRWHPVLVAGCLAGVAALAAVAAIRDTGPGFLLWTMLGATAGFATSGSV
ncbi:hypothetical protein ABNF97_13885 [Plantactinospora sp. B6F1]|uniref:hypothetical protein n=1 Tax=Plantactinospora sp. B6F1 TaxID=3158971 RepID=UPI00102BD2E5